jgi:hypothetical protein
MSYKDAAFASIPPYKYFDLSLSKSRRRKGSNRAADSDRARRQLCPEETQSGLTIKSAGDFFSLFVDVDADFIDSRGGTLFFFRLVFARLVLYG